VAIVVTTDQLNQVVVIGLLMALESSFCCDVDHLEEQKEWIRDNFVALCNCLCARRRKEHQKMGPSVSSSERWKWANASFVQSR
jgi:hypothetical protein